MIENMQAYLIETFWSEEDNTYLCLTPDLPGCSAAGNTPLEAIQEMQDAMASWLQGLRKYGPRVTCSLGKTPQSSLTIVLGAAILQ